MAARKALSNLLQPLAGFILDAGLSANELHGLIRESIIRSVRDRQMEVAGRINISGIAASTGIPRAEISRILSLRPEVTSSTDDQQATNRILSVWHEDPEFTTPNGQPADLRIFGRGKTFDSLVRNYGRGIPTRAMLDELSRGGAVEVLSSQKVRAKSELAVAIGVSPRAIRVFGERATELLSSMLNTMRSPERSRFIANIEGATVLRSALPLIRKEVASKGAEFLAGIQDNLLNGPFIKHTKHATNAAYRVSVTVFYHEASRVIESAQKKTITRRNFRRAPKIP